MPHDVIMPQMGESIAEGTITAWLKKPGDAVALDEPLFEISTDKVDAEIPSPAAGVLWEIVVPVGKTVAINTVVARLDAPGAQPTPKPVSVETGPVTKPAAVVPPAPAPVTPAAPAITDVETRRRTKSSPLVRRIAQEHGIDVSQLTGSGISGRVTKDDILSFISTSGVGRAEATAAAPSTAAASAITQVPAAYQARAFDGDRIEPLSAMRAKIAEHMVLSRKISAHVQTVWDMDFSHVAKLRAAHKTTWKDSHGVNLTFTAFVLKATVDALKAFPVMNASMNEREVIYHRHINLGLAVALDWGLLVPVIHQAEELNMLGLARRAQDLAERARAKKLKPDEVQRGTFTVTNPGVFGNVFGLPVINQPQVGILGLGGIEKRVVVLEGDALAIRTKAYLSLSFDHRLIDGAVAEQFMARLKQGIEKFDPQEL